MDKVMKILHIITGLNTGGAERMLVKLIEETKNDIEHSVISLLDGGTQGDYLREIGVNIFEISSKSLIKFPKYFHRINKAKKKVNPDLIQGWMYHGNLVASLVKVLNKKLPVIYNVRHSLHSIKHEKQLTRWIIKLNSYLSANAAAVIYNSNISRNQHEEFGFDASTSITIPNGFFVDTFKNNETYRDEIRNELMISKSKFVFGQIGRNHPMKDYKNYVKAAKIVLEEGHDCHFLLVGRGIENDSKLQELVKGKESNFSFIGQRNDIEKIWNTVDVGVLSSAWGEGFPNVVGEAMACEKPCVVTDVGDAAFVVGKTGEVVQPQNSKELSASMIKMLMLRKKELKELGYKARKRIVENFSIEKVSKDYINLYESILNKKSQ